MRTSLLFFSLVFPLSVSFAEENEPAPLPDTGQGYEHVEKFIQVLESIRENHPDASLVSYERLVNHALEGMLDSLDNFSAFYHPDTYSVITDGIRSPELPGLGLTLGKSDSALTVTAVRDHSSAAKAGVLPGDRILKIKETDATPLSFSEALDLLSGTPGETVALTFFRKSDLKNHTVELLRSVVKQAAVAEAFLLEEAGDDKVGYLRLSEFTATSHREVEIALDDLEDKGMKALILDLRGNPGGLLDAAVAILGEFVPPSTEVVFTKGRNPTHSTPPLKTPDRKRRKRDYPLVTLLDRGSASASELVAGALQDLERARIIGEQSYGKGSVQNIFSQDNGTALRLTIATYHTPSGRTPHEVGITPDDQVEISDTDRETLTLWYRRANATPAERETLTQWKDPVLTTALKALAKQK